MRDKKRERFFSPHWFIRSMASVLDASSNSYVTILENEATCIVKVKLRQKLKDLEANWALFRSSAVATCSSSFVNPLSPSINSPMEVDTSNYSNNLMDGPNFSVARHDLKDGQASSFASVDAIIATMKLDSMELLEMADTIKTYIGILAPVKRSGTTLAVDVQSSLVKKLDNVVSFGEQFVSLLSNFSRSRANAIKSMMDINPSEDTNQSLYEYDQVICIGLTRAFVLLHMSIAWINDAFDVRISSEKHFSDIKDIL